MSKTYEKFVICPFCGSNNIEQIFRWPGKLIARCKGCGAEGPNNLWDWNKRIRQNKDYKNPPNNALTPQTHT